MADYINSTIEPDIIIWTGDTAPHIEDLNPTFVERRDNINWVN